MRWKRQSRKLQSRENRYVTARNGNVFFLVKEIKIQKSCESVKWRLPITNTIGRSREAFKTQRGSRHWSTNREAKASDLFGSSPSIRRKMTRKKNSQKIELQAATFSNQFNDWPNGKRLQGWHLMKFEWKLPFARIVNFDGELPVTKIQVLQLFPLKYLQIEEKCQFRQMFWLFNEWNKDRARDTHPHPLWSFWKIISFLSRIGFDEWDLSLKM